jgi:hypothetical protein
MASHYGDLGLTPGQVMWALWALGQVFSKYFGFPCCSFSPLIAPQS